MAELQREADTEFLHPLAFSPSGCNGCSQKSDLQVSHLGAEAKDLRHSLLISQTIKARS